MPPPRGSGRAQHAQDTCLHGNALHPERQNGTRPGPVRGTPRSLIRQSQKPEVHFPFSPANWSGVMAEGPTPPRTPVTACSHWRFRSKIGKPYRQTRFDCCSLSHIINNLSDVLNRQKRSNGDFSSPKIRICFVQSDAALRISMGKEVTLPPDSLNFSNIAAIYRQYHCRSIDHAHHELC